jgi:hypothetical protein
MTTGAPSPTGEYGILSIHPDAVAWSCRGHQAMYWRLVAASGCDEHDVIELRVSECRVELDVVDFVDPDWPIRTISVEPQT